MKTLTDFCKTVETGVDPRLLSNSLTYVYCVVCLCRFFWLVLWIGICVVLDVDRITILSPPPDFFPTHNSFFNTSDSYLKSARA